MSQKSEPLVLRPASPVESFGEMARNVKSLPPFLEFPRCNRMADSKVQEATRQPSYRLLLYKIQQSIFTI